MKPKMPYLLFMLVLLISLSCTCPGSDAINQLTALIPGSSASDGVQDQNPLGSATDQKSVKVPQGELAIRDQWFMQSGNPADPLISVAVLIENTDTELAVVDWDMQLNFYDTAGSPILLDTGLEGGKLPIQESVIFPGSQYLFCTNLSGEANKTAGRFDVVLDPKTPGVSLPSARNPLSINNHVFLPESRYNNAVGTERVVLQNANPAAVVLPLTTAALYDASGKLNGCGHSANSPLFVPGGGQAVSEFAVFSGAAPASTQVFVSMMDVTGSEFYLPVEPLVVSGATVTTVGEYLIPAFTLSKTTEGVEDLDFFVNVTAFDAQGGIVWTDSFRRDGYIKPGQLLGPYFYNPISIRLSQPPVSLQVAVHTSRTSDLDEVEPVLEISSPNYDPASQQVLVNISNPTNRFISAGIYAACFDAAQNITALGSTSEMILEGTTVPVSIYTPALTGEGCANAEIRISYSNIY